MNKKKYRILFVCHGNICRSPMAEFIMREMLKEEGLSESFEIDSAATSREELGNPVYPPAKAKLEAHGIQCDGKYAVRMSREDYERYDLIICMDHMNIRNVLRITGDDHEGKVRLLLDFTGREGEEVADPWYTRNFDEAWNDITEGCKGLLEYLKRW